MKRTYKVADRTDKRVIEEFLKREGQFLLPSPDDGTGGTSGDGHRRGDRRGGPGEAAMLELSPEGVAGPKQAGKKREGGSVVWYGRQGGQVYLSDRKVRVERPAPPAGRG